MMSPISMQLLELARRNAAVYAANPSIEAIMVTGSVARGEADCWSDIDTILYYNVLPEENFLLNACEKLGGVRRSLIFHDPDAGTAEQFYVEGVACQFAHLHAERMEEDIDAVTDRLETDVNKHTALGGLLDAIPLHGAAQIAEWKARAAYPEGLAELVIREQLRFYPLWLMRDMFAGRGDLLFFYRALTEAETNLVSIVLALNRRYLVKEVKRMDSLLGALAIAPVEFASRLRAILRAEPSDAVHELGLLIDDTLTLVERDLPTVDTTKARERVCAPQPDHHRLADQKR